MSQINVTNLTFGYEGSYDNIFENVSFCIDSDWKLGFIGRNGKGKSTFLNLLLGKYAYQGNIHSSTTFEYFPYQIKNEMRELNTIDVIETIEPEYEMWKICRELDYLQTDADILYRPFCTLSFGEQTKAMLALLFSKENQFLLIDEPTNHLDMLTREVVKNYLKSKRGFILVSHDRDLLNACVDHVLVLNRNSIEVQKGNFASWWENKQRQDSFERAENEKLNKEIDRLKEAAKRTEKWAEKVEKSKIGYDPLKDTHRCIDSRAYMGEKSRRMQKKRKVIEGHRQSAIDEKKGLLKDIENPIQLKLMPEEHYKDSYIRFADVSLAYDDKSIIEGLSFELNKGDRLVLQGKNGCGKSSVVKAILSNENVILTNAMKEEMIAKNLKITGEIAIPKGLKVSYINQDTSMLNGSLNDYIRKAGADESLFKAILRQLDFERVQFEKKMEDYSEGQKKKVLIVSSLLSSAHLYIWDEPLNYIDVFSRMQIEELIKTYQPTMLIIEHDRTFCEEVGNKITKDFGRK